MKKKKTTTKKNEEKEKTEGERNGGVNDELPAGPGRFVFEESAALLYLIHLQGLIYHVYIGDHYMRERAGVRERLEGAALIPVSLAHPVN